MGHAVDLGATCGRSCIPAAALRTVSPSWSLKVDGDPQLAVVTAAPLLGLVHRFDADVVRDRLGGADEVQLARRRLRGLPGVVEARDVFAGGRQLVGPRLRLPALRRLRSNEPQPESGRFPGVGGPTGASRARPTMTRC